MVFVRAVVFLLIAAPAMAQNGSIAGRVTGSDNGEVLPYTNVFVNNTTLGTASDANGYFVLRNIPSGPVEVVFSFVGYQTYQTRVQIVAGQQLTLNIRLVVDEKLLESVHVAARQDKEWETNLKRFKKIFLGTDRIAIQSKIVNPWVIEFKKEGENLIATASEPIIVENEALGYTVTYFLSRFSARGADYVIQGKVRFAETKTLDPVVAERWSSNRLEIYRGSTRHFLKSVLARRIHENGFQIYSDRLGYETSPKSTVFQHELGNTIEPFDTSRIEIIPENKSRFVRIAFKKPKIEVHYLKSITTLKGYEDLSTPVSWLDIKTGTVRIDSSGNVYENLVASGYMASLRVGNLLPNDYEPVKSGSLVNAANALKASDINDLREHAYVMTDKPYYYQGDVMWFAGQMIYHNPARRDTLSKVLYVELIGPKKNIIRSSTCYINNGRAAGQFFLNDSLPPGNYFLRAYTNWMRNFDDRIFFVKPLRILGSNETVVGPVAPAIQNDSLLDAVELHTDKESYSKREKITLRVEVFDGDEYNRSTSVFAVSVIDAKQVLNITQENILTRFQAFEDSVPFHSQNDMPIEKGISVAGDVSLQKEKDKKAKVTLIQRKQEDYAMVDTDEHGRFWVTGFQFLGTARFSMQAKNGKGKLLRQINLHQQPPPPVNFYIPPSDLDIRAESQRQLNKVDYVSMGDKDREPVAEVVQPVTHIKPDYSISRERLANERFGTLFSFIRSVPGLYVYANSSGDPIGSSVYSYRLEYGTRNQEPLLVIDGVAQPIGESIAVQLDRINISNVDHVDLIKHDLDGQYGMRGTGGIIFVYTKEKAGQGAVLERRQFETHNFQMVTIKGYDRPVVFKSPDYEKQNADTLVDDRSLLYWNPAMTTNEKGEVSVSFYAGDLLTTYRIVLEGMTPANKPFHIEKFIEVK